ncbi:MAG TPA: porin, partial [Odoribacter splanchnicus]|nr:porin [Odoribacter splanchnicus]
GEAAAKSEPVSANEEELLNKILSKLPKVSGYIQTGYNYGDKNGDNRSSF